MNFLHDVCGVKPELNSCYSSPVSLADLLAGFFHFFAQFDFDSRCLCPIAGETRAKDTRWKNSSAMDIVNPLETDLNLAYNLNKQAVKRFQMKAAEALSELAIGEREGGGGGVFDILAGNSQRRQTVGLRQTKLRDMDLFSESVGLKEVQLPKAKTPEPEVETFRTPEPEVRSSRSEHEARTDVAQNPPARRARTPSPLGPRTSARKPIILLNGLFEDTTSFKDELPKRSKNKSQPQGVDVLKSKVNLPRDKAVKIEAVETDAVKRTSPGPKSEPSMNNLRSGERVKEAKVSGMPSSEQLRIEDLKMKYLRGSVQQSDKKL